MQVNSVPLLRDTDLRKRSPYVKWVRGGIVLEARFEEGLAGAGCKGGTEPPGGGGGGGGFGG